VELQSPVMAGQIVAENVLGTGVNFVSCRNI
jgi:CxxC motif-containing protein